MPNRVFVVGVGMTKFEKPGRREGWDYPQMAKESGTKALEDAGVDFSEVQQGSGTSPATRPADNALSTSWG
jgi:acetyl-CoA acyltransferase